MSLYNFGTTVSGIDDIRQCIDVLLNTPTGSVPFMPLYGCDILSDIDKPINQVIPATKKKIIDAIDIFEPRVTLQEIKHELTENGVNYFLYMLLPDGSPFNYTHQPEAATEQITRLFTLLAKLTGGLRYYVSLTIDGIEYNSNPFGYLSIQELWDWIQSNWTNIGDWKLLPTRSEVLLYVLAKSASFKITTLFGAHALLPALASDEFYLVRYNSLFAPDGISDKNAMVDWLNQNWQQYGKWETDGTYLIFHASGSNGNSIHDLEVIAVAPGDFDGSFDNSYSI